MNKKTLCAVVLALSHVCTNTASPMFKPLKKRFGRSKSHGYICQPLCQADIILNLLENIALFVYEHNPDKATAVNELLKAMYNFISLEMLYNFDVTEIFNPFDQLHIEKIKQKCTQEDMGHTKGIDRKGFEQSLKKFSDQINELEIKITGNSNGLKDNVIKLFQKDLISIKDALEKINE